MEIDTPIAEGIHATDQSARYDATCKRLLSQKIILAWIMKSCLKEYRDCDVKEIAEKYIEGTPQVGIVLPSPEAGEAKKRQVLEDEFDIPMTETLETEVRQMCNLSEGVRDLGRAEGRAEGRSEGFLASIRSLMASMGWSVEQAMDALQLSDDDRTKCAKLFQKQ